MTAMQAPGIAPLYPTQPLSAGHHLAFPSILDATTFLSAPTFRGFFVLSASAELAHEASFLDLLFEQTQGKLHVVLLYRDPQHPFTNEAPVRGALPAASQDSR
jgi:hypothetical protein